jgi:CarD family transcriptional regulator
MKCDIIYFVERRPNMSRYKIGDYLMHESAGVCQVDKIEELALSGKGSEKEYYELRPVYQEDGQVITPVDDKNGRLRDIKSREEMETILNNTDDIGEINVSNNREFQDKVKSVIADFDPRSLASVLKTVYIRKKRRLSTGKKTMSMDERVLQVCGKKLFDEMAFVLQKKQDDVAGLFYAGIDKTLD